MGKFKLSLLLGIFLTLVFGCVNGVAQATTSAEQPYSIVLSTESTIAKPGAPVYAKITVKNARDYLLPIQEGYRPTDLTAWNGIGLDGRYTWSCTNGAAQRVTKLGSDRYYVAVQPGRTRVISVRLDLACDLSEPGLYRATVSRRSRWRSNQPVASSNSISFEVK